MILLSIIPAFKWNHILVKLGFLQRNIITLSGKHRSLVAYKQWGCNSKLNNSWTVEFSEKSIVHMKPHTRQMRTAAFQCKDGQLWNAMPSNLKIPATREIGTNSLQLHTSKHVADTSAKPMWFSFLVKQLIYRNRNHAWWLSSLSHTLMRTVWLTDILIGLLSSVMKILVGPRMRLHFVR